MEFIKKQRDIKKQEKNPIEALYKLLGNSLYGRMLMKPIASKRVFKKRKELKSYLLAHSTAVKGFTELKNSSWVIIEECKEILSHFSLPHIGSEILSQSKHIMNIPLMLAEDNGLSNYYMDTDSMHVTKRELPRLEQLFRDKVGYELLGDEYCQFKCDFELKDEQGRNCTDVEAVETFILGKKCYLDMLEGRNPDGELTQGFHARIKGCSKAALNAKAIEMLPNAPLRNQVREVYQALMDNQVVEFNLLAKGDGAKLGFQANKDFTTSTRETFTRRYSFPGPVNYSVAMDLCQ